MNDQNLVVTIHLTVSALINQLCQAALSFIFRSNVRTQCGSRRHLFVTGGFRQNSLKRIHFLSRRTFIYRKRPHHLIAIYFLSDSDNCWSHYPLW